MPTPLTEVLPVTRIGRKLKTVRIIAAVAAELVLSDAAAARASDFCMELGNETFVGQHFKLPAPGRCRPFTGFLVPGGFVVGGTACTTSSGSHTDFDLTESALVGDVADPPS